MASAAWEHAVVSTSKHLIVRRLIVILFVFDVHAKEMHFFDHKNILKNTGYMHINDFGKHFCHFSAMAFNGDSRLFIMSLLLLSSPQTKRVERFLCFIAQTTRSDIRMCLFSVSLITNRI